MNNYFLSMLILLPQFSLAQSVGIGTENPNPSAKLDVTSTSKGLLIPRLTEAQKEGIANPATGLLIWQTNGTPGFYYNNGTPEAPKWLMLSAALDTDWKLTGNNNVDSATHFLGSINQAPVFFKVRNTWAGQVDSGKGTHFGYKAGWKAPDKFNTAFGTEALSAPSEGGENTAFGYFAGKQIRTGQANTAMGSEALSKNTAGTANIAIGARSMVNNVVGVFNTAVGAFALETSESANFNTAVGYLALRFNTANSNTALGCRALLYNSSGSNNTGVGRETLYRNTTGFDNVGVGFNSLSENVNGYYNIAMGTNALQSNIEGSSNVAVGIAALKLNTSSSNTAVGNFALLTNNTGYQNTAIGENALSLNQSGYKNVATGHNALLNQHNGRANVALGFEAGISLISGSGNTFLGYRSASLADNFTINNATAIGNKAVVGCNNCLVLGSVDGINEATASVNVGIGTTTPTEVLTINGTNPIVQLQHAGSNKGFLQITGGDDVKIGTKLGNNTSSFFVSTNGADRVKVDASGNVGVGTSSPTVKFQVGVNGDGTVARANAWQTFSDERFKMDIIPINDAVEKIKHLQGYYYHWKSGSDHTRQAGLLAQEVEKVLPEIVSTDAEGYKSVDYGKMNALLLQALKEQNRKMDELQTQIENLKKLISK